MFRTNKQFLKFFEHIYSIVITISLIFFIIWWISVDKFAYEENLYARNEYCKDVCKIYYDLGYSYQKRKDWNSAINAYSAGIDSIIKNKQDLLSLSHYQDIRTSLISVYKELNYCYEKINDKNNAFKAYCAKITIMSTYSILRLNQTNSQLCNKNIWSGQSLKNKTIYVFTENEPSESILFYRFLPHLANLGATVLFKPQPMFKNYFTDSQYINIKIIDENIDLATIEFDYYTPLLNIPYILDIEYQNIPNYKNHIKPSQKKIDQFNFITKNKKKYTIGIAWNNDNYKNNSKQNYLNFNLFYEIAKIPGVQCYALQNDFKKLLNQNLIIPLDHMLQDITDFVGAMHHLDLIVSANTLITHLAGSIEKPVWILLPDITDWYWFAQSETDNSIWYKSAKKVHLTQQKNCKPLIKFIQNNLRYL